MEMRAGPCDSPAVVIRSIGQRELGACAETTPAAPASTDRHAEKQKGPTSWSGLFETVCRDYGQVVVKVFGSCAMTTPFAVAPTRTSCPDGRSAAVTGPMIGSLIGMVPTLR